MNKDAQGCTPLHMAAMEGRDAVVELLMANKSEINAKNNYGQTPLHMAAHKTVIRPWRNCCWLTEPRSMSNITLV